jgi:hypothetical protein
METHPGIDQFHPKEPKTVSWTDHHPHIKDCRPSTDGSIASLAKVTKVAI